MKSVGGIISLWISIDSILFVIKKRFHSVIRITRWLGICLECGPSFWTESIGKYIPSFQLCSENQVELFMGQWLVLYDPSAIWWYSAFTAALPPPSQRQYLNLSSSSSASGLVFNVHRHPWICSVSSRVNDVGCRSLLTMTLRWEPIYIALLREIVKWMLPRRTSLICICIACPSSSPSLVMTAALRRRGSAYILYCAFNRKIVCKVNVGEFAGMLLKCFLQIRNVGNNII